ncbi:MAG: hypothetical protein Ta2B_03410 [Termitinemataceae bacterium]|nr:MAG: hypothetical protein Ta2B_03410 [Termitinemataceae bacterium]
MHSNKHKGTSKNSCAIILQGLSPHLFAENARHNTFNLGLPAKGWHLTALFGFKQRQNPSWYYMPLIFRDAYKIAALALFFFLTTMLAAADPDNTKRNTNISGRFDWQKMSVSLSVRCNLKGLNIKYPTGRIQAEDFLKNQYMENVLPFLLSIQVDSSTVLGSLIDLGLLQSSKLDEIAMSAKKVPPYYTDDFSAISSSYTLDLVSVSDSLSEIKDNVAEMITVFNTMSTATYTGIIIVADGKLPVHGKRTSEYLVPSLFPKIWDSDMKLIFDKNMSYLERNVGSFFVNWTSADKVFSDTPSGIDKDLAKIVGNNPLRIIASEVYGISPTDPVIDPQDAIRLLSSESNKKLLREGRIAIVIEPSALFFNFESSN